MRNLRAKLRWRAPPYFRFLAFFGAFFFWAFPADLLADFGGLGATLEGFSAACFFASGLAGTAAKATAGAFAPFAFPLTATPPFLPAAAVPEVPEPGPLAPAAAA